MQPDEKPPLVLIHGFRGSPLGLETIADLLRQSGYDVHTPALPPFASAKFSQDENNTVNYTPETYAKYLRQYINQNYLNHPILIGHSMGSIVAAATARYYPESINQKLILLSPISTKPTRAVKTISPLANYLPNGTVDYLTTKFLFVPHNRELFKEAIITTHKCSNDQPPSKTELSKAIKFSTSYSVTELLDGVEKEIIIIAGEKDRLIHQTKTIKLANQYNAWLELIPNSGHLHNYENPSETARLILKAID